MGEEAGDAYCDRISASGRGGGDEGRVVEWELGLPGGHHLVSLSQTLIPPELASAFRINPEPARTLLDVHRASQHTVSNLRRAAPSPAAAAALRYFHPFPSPAADDDDDDDDDDEDRPVAVEGDEHSRKAPRMDSASPSPAEEAESFAPPLENSNDDQSVRTLKRPRLVWTPQLHKRFVDAVAHLGIKNAVPKTIMQLMSVDGLTRENVASHLQKYRLYLKRMQGLSTSGGGGGGGGPISASDAATDQLFASAPVPHHFLSRRPVAGLGGPDPFLPYMPVTALQHHQQITAAMQQQQHYHQRHLGHFGSPTGGGGFDHGFLNRPAVSQSGMHQMLGAAPGMGLMQLTPSSAASFVDDLEPARGGSGERKVLTLFPTGED